jgi:hypothetical protein
MDKIIIFDNFLDENTINLLIEIINKKTWTFGHKSNENDSFSTPFFYMDLINEKFALLYIKDKIEEKLSKKITLKRCYANGQTFGQDGSYHIDDPDEKAFTFCLYINKINKIEIEIAGGNFNIKIPNEKFIISIEPLFNRGILFPSNYFHKGHSFSRYVNELRISVVWKFYFID